MKTAKWWASAVSSVCLAAASPATVFLQWEEDLRGAYDEADGLEGEIRSVGGSVRKVFSDRRGDRLILFAQAEAARNLSEGMLHQAYAEWKGPMGRWNLALGRVPLPWGLLTDWSPDRMPYGSPHIGSGALSSDNGLLARGILGAWDYGLALTQGYGMESVREVPGPGNLTGRVGRTAGREDNFNAGLTASVGTVHLSEHGHGQGPTREEERIALALDWTWYAGRGVYRFEGGSRRTEGRWRNNAFAAADFALLPRVSLQMAGQAFQADPSDVSGRVYAGVSVPLASVTVRGGYEYERAHKDTHRVVVQLHRQFSLAR